MDYCSIPAITKMEDAGGSPQSPLTPYLVGRNYLYKRRCLEGILVEENEAVFLYTGCYEVVSCMGTYAVIRVKKETEPLKTYSALSLVEMYLYLASRGPLLPRSDILCGNVPCKNGCYEHG